MKGIVVIICVGLIALMFSVYVSLYLWIDSEVKENIRIAKEKYPGRAEDALIAYLLDTANPPRNRTKVAIWTLGRIQSEKAIPVLKGLYKNDPEGKTCKGKHDTVLCQYEIYKALNAVRVNWWPMHARLNK
jgi:hypothetical protein